jgi:hypothetical protein
MAEYSDDSSVSGSDSGDEIEAALKAVPTAVVPIKTKRVYTRKNPLSDEQKSAIVSKLQKARAAKAGNLSKKKQVEAQEVAELKELKKLKAEGKLKIKKERPESISVPKKEKAVKEVKSEVHHHYYGAAEPEDGPKPARVKKQPVPEPPPTPRASAPKPAKMLFA